MPRRLATLLAFLALDAAPALHAQTPTPAPTPPPTLTPSPAPEPEPLVLDLVKNPARHWSFAVPKGWTLAPQTIADQIDAEMDRLLPDKGFRCVAVVWADPTRGTRGPNLQVQFAPADHRDLTLDQIDASLANTRDLAERRRREQLAAGERLLASDESPPTLDRANLRILSTGSLTVPAAPPEAPSTIRFQNTAFLGREGLVRILLYAPDAEFAAARTQAADALESFQFEPGWGYQPPTPQSALSTVFRRSGLSILAVLVVIFILRTVFRRKKTTAP